MSDLTDREQLIASHSLEAGIQQAASMADKMADELAAFGNTHGAHALMAFAAACRSTNKKVWPEGRKS